MKPITAFIAPDDLRPMVPEIHAAGRRIAPLLCRDLPALLGRETHGLHQLARRAEDRGMLEPWARDLLQTVIAACERQIRAGTTTREDWFEAGYSQGAPDYACRMITVLTPRAHEIDGIRANLAAVNELIERILDLRAAQDTGADLRR